MEKIAAIIARVSTGVQDYQRQVDDLTQLAINMGYQVPDKFIYSEKISGFTIGDERTALNQIIDEIKTTGRIEMVFAESASRIARKPSVGHGFVETLTDLGIPVYISNMNCASIERGVRNKAFFIQYAMLLEFARIDAEDLKAKFKSGKLNSIKEGRATGGDMVIYGYDKGERTDKKAPKYVINPLEAKVVKRVFQMYINGSGCMVIANYLNNQDIPTKTGKQWSIGTVTQLLKNPFYWGSRLYKGQLYENVVPAIISKETFLKAKEIAKQRDINPEKNIKYLYLLKDKIYCGYCGAKYLAKFRPKKHSHYMCWNRSSNVIKRTCEACGIGIDKIESLVWEVVMAELGVFNYIQRFNDVLKQNEKEIENLKLKIAAYNSELETKSQQIKKWNRLFVMDKIGEDELNLEVGKLETSINNINEKLSNIKSEIKSKQQMVAKGSNFKAYKKLVKTIGVDRVKINEVMKNVLDKVIITSTKTGSMCDTFIVTIYMTGGILPTSVLFDKKKMVFWANPRASAGVKYDSKGILQNDIDKLEKGLKMAYEGVTFKGSKIINTEPAKVEHIPFTRLNVLTGNKPV